MPRKGENIYARKDGRWEGRYVRGKTESGKCCYGYVYAKSYREVKEKLIRKKSEVPEVLLQQEDIGRPEDGKIFFGTLMEEWLNSLKPQVKESTYIKYRNTMSNYIFPELEHVIWYKFKRDTLESFCNKMLLCGGAKGKGLSTKTVSDILSMIRNVFRYAAACGYVQPFDISSVSVKRNTKELRIFSRKEQEILCRYLYQNMNDQNLGILISLFTGLRIGEVCALKWEDISYKEKTLYVHQTMQRLQNDYELETKTKISISTPKSPCSIRRIPIPDELARILKKYQRGRKGYVLTGEEDIYMEPRAMQRHFKRTLKCASLEPVKYHVLRHTFATRCVEMNFDVKSLSEILGHASVNITMNRYVHPSMDLKRENMQRLSELLAVR